MLRVPQVCVVLLLLVFPRPAAAAWTLLRSENFVFVGDAPERDLRRVAQKLEQFRDIVGRLVPWAAGPVLLRLTDALSNAKRDAGVPSAADWAAIACATAIAAALVRTRASLEYRFMAPPI